MKLLFWNVNGIRSILKKEIKLKYNLQSYVYKHNFDFVCLNETKICKTEINKIDFLEEYNYKYHSHSCIKKGYSGVSIITKHKPEKQHFLENDTEGRIVCLEYKKFILLCVYQPNSGAKLNRLEYRTQIWDILFLNFVISLLKLNKQFILVGDMNVARTDIDIHNSSKHLHSAGFTIEERINFENFLKKTKLLDIWRDRNPKKIEYTYFDYRSKARLRNAGWRIDYILCSSGLNEKIKKIKFLNEINGSDHIPIFLEF